MNPIAPADPGKLVGLGDDVPFELRLAQTIAWCAPRARIEDPCGSLRDAQLGPRVLEVDRTTVVRSVVRSRQRNVPFDLPAVQRLSDLQAGRLLVYFPDAELADGAAEAATGGFFDVNNAPPWDTWVALFRDAEADDAFADYIVAWVPAIFVELAAGGIDVNPEGSVAWLADASTRVTSELRTQGLVG